MQSEILNHALEYLRSGFSVIPLFNRGKKPRIQWAEYQSKLPTEDEVQSWWKKWPNANIGIVTGKISNLFVMDLDSPEAIQFITDKGIPITPTVETGRGKHLYFKWSQDISNFQKTDSFPNVDFRGDGGYIVAPPSLHLSGKTYRWNEGQSYKDISFAELPQWVLTQSKTDKQPLPTLYSGVIEGSRNNSMIRLLGSLIKDKTSEENALQLMQAWNSLNRPPLNEKEVITTVKNAYQKYYEGKSSNNPIQFLVKGSDLMKMNTKVEWLIENLIPKQSITLLHGRGGVGKTWLTLQIAAAVSKGQSFIGLPTKKTTIVYVDYENPLPMLVERVRILNGTEVNFWHAAFKNPPPRLDSDNFKIFKELPKESLIIIDTLRASQNNDENSSKEMASIMNRLKELRDDGFTILLLHHTPKADSSIYKGSTTILDLVDHVLSLENMNKDSEDSIKNTTLCLRTRNKTRFKPFLSHIIFIQDKGFELASDPVEEKLVALRDIIEELKLKNGKLPNQTQVRDTVKELWGMKGKGDAVKLLKKGEGKYWKKTKKENKSLYDCLTVPIYNKEDSKTDTKTNYSAQAHQDINKFENPEKLKKELDEI